MSYLPHHLSSEAVKCEVDVHTVPPTQVCIQGCKDGDFLPIAAIQGTNQLEFFIPGSGEDYLDLSNTYLHLTARILLENGNNIPDDAKVVPVNNFMHSLFSEVSMNLGDKQITASDQEYAYKAYFKTTISSAQLHGKSFLSAEMYYKDKSPSENDPTKAVEGCGIKKRFERSKKSGQIDMIGRLKLDICEQDKLIVNDVDVRIKMILSKPEFCLLAADKNAYKIDVVNAVLYAHKVTVSPPLILAHAKSADQGSFKYTIKRTECRTFSVGSGLSEIDIPNAFLGPQPTFIMMGLVNSAAKNGDITLNPFHFQHKHVSSLSVHIDGIQYPSVPFQPKFGANQWVRPYQEFFKAIGQYYGSIAPEISYEEYGAGTTLYALDLTPDQSALDGTHFNLIKNGSMRINLRFEKPLDKNMSLVVFAVFQNIIEIDKSRNVTTDY